MNPERTAEIGNLIDEALRDEDKKAEIELRKEAILQDLFHAVNALKKRFHWTNTDIVNKSEELDRFKKCIRKDTDYRPNFKFKKFQNDVERALNLLENLEKETEKIDRAVVKEKEFEYLEKSDLRNLFRGIFEQYKLYVRLQSNIENRKKWKDTCERIWQEDRKTAKYAKKRLQQLEEPEEPEKEMKAEEVKQMWENEIERLDMDYEVQVKNVSGCHNIPEERKLVVARGKDTERLYSLEEARMLTIHEVFHAVRTYNGYKTVEDSGVPPLTALQTPFYDRTEEGGAVYREVETGIINSYKEMDYYLRTLAADGWQREIKFQENAERLIEHGASQNRAFGLVARNREVLRHQIYLGGFLDWRRENELEPLMLGKVNMKWAGKLWKEVEKDGPFSRPEVKPDQLFEKTSLAFDT